MSELEKKKQRSKTRGGGVSADITPRVTSEPKPPKESKNVVPMSRITSIVPCTVLDALSNLTLFVGTSNCRTIAVILENWCQQQGLVPVNQVTEVAYQGLVGAANQARFGVGGKLKVTPKVEDVPAGEAIAPNVGAASPNPLPPLKPRPSAPTKPKPKPKGTV